MPAGDLRAADQPDGGGGSGGGGTGTGKVAARQEEALRRRMQVYLTAWLLSPEVQEARVDAHLAVLTADMVGF